MFAEVNVAAAMKLNDGLEAPLTGYHSPAVMVKVNDCCTGKIVHLPAGIPDAFAVVSINVIGEALVKISNLAQHLPANHH